jgi:hypothetical protein
MKFFFNIETPLSYEGDTSFYSLNWLNFFLEISSKSVRKRSSKESR